MLKDASIGFIVLCHAPNIQFKGDQPHIWLMTLINSINITHSFRSFEFRFSGLPPCTTPETITLMRILILLCFMVLLCSCIGVLINVTSLNSKVIKMLRRNAVPSIMCVFWVIAIVGVCYYTTVVLGMANSNDPNTIQVDYEYGFYTITGAGKSTSYLTHCMCNKV